MKKILFYSDSPIWGGHEEMTLLLANTIAKVEGIKVTFVYNHINFDEKLSDSITKIKTDIRTKTPLPCLRSFSICDTLFLKRLFTIESPQAIIVSQGCIERSLKGIFAAILSNIKVISYIPLAFEFREIDGALWPLRDIINKIYYRLPNSYITVSQYQKNLLSRFITPTQNIKILYNPAECMPENMADGGQVKFSDQLNLLCAGRIYLKHKNQSALVGAARVLKEKKFSAKFIIAGEGPDTNKLKKEINRLKVNEYFEMVGWIKDLKCFIKNRCDLLIVPSHYESCLPLTVLEACAENKPFLISKRGFIQEYDLSENFTFNCQDPVEIANKIMTFKENFSQSSFQKIRAKILDTHNTKQYPENVENIALSLTEK